MERSLDGRPPLVRLLATLAQPLLERDRRGPRGRRARPGTHGLRHASAIAGVAAALWSRLMRRRRLGIALVVAALLAPLLTGGWLWLRHSSLVAVERVRVTGASGADAQAVEAALVEAARRMSTLDVNTRALRASVARFPIVATVSARAGFPHALRITVVERKPVAELNDGASATAVGADGVVLGPQALAHGLPAVAASFEPPPGRRLTDPRLLGPLAILAAAPRPVLHLIVRAFDGPHGITLAMRNGLDVYFGDSSLPHAKWLALGRVLADPSSSGALYIDLSVPSHPAAGFAGTVARSSEGEAGSEGQPAGGASTENTVAALASQLSANAPGAQSSGTSGSSESSPSGTSGSAESSSTGSEAGAESESETGTEASRPTG